MRNNIFTCFIFLVAFTGQIGCQKNPELYHYPLNGINILDTLVRYSFVFSASGTVQDTVWVRIQTMGFLSKDDRPIAFEQISAGARDAVAGVHYVAFDQSELQKLYVMPRNGSTTSVPVVLKRDPSLEQEEYTLLFQVRKNDFFGRGIVGAWSCRVVISDRLARPANWNFQTEMEFGEYGRVKHRWLIEQTGNRWDDEYLRDILGFEETDRTNLAATTNANYDSGYNVYYGAILQMMLDAYNERNGTILMEEDNTPVTFI